MHWSSQKSIPSNVVNHCGFSALDWPEIAANAAHMGLSQNGGTPQNRQVEQGIGPSGILKQRHVMIGDRSHCI